MGSVLASTICHYCGPAGIKATTQDHVVPRAILPKPLTKLPYWYRSCLVVPSCFHCNGVKAEDRSDCTCGMCEWLWTTALKLWLPKDYEPKVVKVEHVSQARRFYRGDSQRKLVH